MSTSNPVATKMEYIQQLFLAVHHFIRTEPEVQDLISYLESEPMEFRSIAYESASFGLGLLDFSKGTDLDKWEHFYNQIGKIHRFHFEIGLGWAFAKTKTLPSQNWKSLHPLMRWMVFDGIGYYHALYKGRRTIKNKIIPEEIEEKDRPGYDQGIGRRLWYVAKGDVEKLIQLTKDFPFSRHSNLWRGIGIACGYVGGSEEKKLVALLKASGEFKKNICTGIALAAISRKTSENVTENIKLACQVFCKMDLDELINLEEKITDQLDTNSEHFCENWIAHFEAEFS